MRLLLIFVLLIGCIGLQQETVRQNTGDLQIEKISWSKYREHAGMVNLDPEPMHGPIVLPTPGRSEEPDHVRNRRDMNQRTAELRGGETDAVRSAKRPEHIYIYRLRIKNTGTKVVKSFIWEYQDSSEVRDGKPRQFCAAKAKPRQTKEVEVYSAFSPSKVITVADSQSKTESKATANINQISFEDGSVWQRPGWEPSPTTEENRIHANGVCVVR